MQHQIGLSKVKNKYGAKKITELAQVYLGSQCWAIYEDGRYLILKVIKVGQGEILGDSRKGWTFAWREAIDRLRATS